MKRKYIIYLFTFLFLLSAIGVFLNTIIYDISPDGYLRDIYGEDNLVYLVDWRTGEQKCCFIRYESLSGVREAATIFPLEQTVYLNVNDSEHMCIIDKEMYKPNEKLNVVISNYGKYDLTWETSAYFVEMKFGEKWIVVGIGEMLDSSKEIYCAVGTEAKMQIDLAEIGKAELKPGKYRFRVNVKYCMADDVSSEKKELLKNGIWLYQEFDIHK